MARVLNLFVLSLTLLSTITGGSRQYEGLDKKINAIKAMMEAEIGMIKEDLAMVVRNLSMSVVGEVQGKNWNVNTLLIANTLVENMKNSIRAAEDFYTVIQRGFISEKMALRKSVSRIEQSVTHLQQKLENVNGDFTSKFQLLNAEINKNKNDIEAKVMKNVNDVKKDLADIAGSFMIKSEALAKFQLVNTEINKNKNDIEAKVDKAKLAPILKSIDDCKTSNSKFASFTTHKYGNSIYFKLNSLMNFYDGKSTCRAYGATLPEVTTAGENNFLTSTFYKYGKMFLGANKYELDSHFLWDHSGQFIMQFTFWNHGEPNDVDGGEDCVELGNQYGSWNDIKCTETKIIVCEFECELTI